MRNDMFSLEGRTALVTGGAYGIGFAIAEALAEAGARIAFNCRSRENLDAATEAYRAKGIEARGYIADVTDEAAVRALVAQIESDLGAIDILVNNAGIIKRIPMTEMSAEDFRQVVDIDLVGPFICAKAVIPGMIKKGRGKIINVCSMMSELGRETVSAYAAAKGGLKMLTRNRRGEHPVQRHRPRLHSDAADRAAARAAGRRQPPPVRQLHRLEDPRGTLGHARGPQRPRRLPRLRRLEFCQRTHSLCRRRHSGLHRQTAVKRTNHGFEAAHPRAASFF